MDKLNHVNPDGSAGEVSRKAYETPRFVKLSVSATESGLVILPIEIMTVQGPS